MAQDSSPFAILLSRMRGEGGRGRQAELRARRPSWEGSLLALGRGAATAMPKSLGCSHSLLHKTARMFTASLSTGFIANLYQGCVTKPGEQLLQIVDVVKLPPPSGFPLPPGLYNYHRLVISDGANIVEGLICPRQGHEVRLRKFSLLLLKEYALLDAASPCTSTLQKWSAFPEKIFFCWNSMSPVLVNSSTFFFPLPRHFLAPLEKDFF